MGFKENLKQLRKAKKLTQKQLAEEIGKTLLTINRYESGAIYPPHEVVKKICLFFNIDVVDICMNVDYENKNYTFDEVVNLLKNKRYDLGKIDVLELIKKEREENEKEYIQLKDNKKIFLENLHSKELQKYIYDIFSGVNSSKNEFDELIESIYTLIDNLSKDKEILENDKIKILKEWKNYYNYLIKNYKKLIR